MPMLNKPRTSRDLYNATMAMNESMARKEERKKALAERAAKQAQGETESILEASYKRDQLQRKYAIFSEDLKNKLLGYAITEIAQSAMQKVNEKLGKQMFSGKENANMTALAYSFIRENGQASSIIYNMNRGGTTQYLGELSKSIKKSHRGMLEGVNPNDPDSFHVGDIAMKDYKDSVTNTFGHEDLVESIADRVAESIKNFITQNAEDKQKIIDAMTATKQKVESLKPDASEELKESYTNLGRRLVTDIREKKHGLFNEMVMTMSRSVLKSENPAVREKFIEGAHINMESVVTGVATMYTFLETVNSMRLTTIDEAYIKDMLKSMMDE